MLIKHYKLSNSKFSLHFINSQKFLSFNDLTYFKIPAYVGISIKALTLSVSCLGLKSQSLFNLFIKGLTLWLKQTNKPFNKKLLLKGLGIRAAISLDLNFLELKLGFSHTIRIKIPHKFLSIKILKNVISVTGCSIVTVSNFLYRIRSYKIPNSYKGKGLWYKNEIRLLKAVKKA